MRAHNFKPFKQRIFWKISDVANAAGGAQATSKIFRDWVRIHWGVISLNLSLKKVHSNYESM